jgi:hypothetical protein
MFAEYKVVADMSATISALRLTVSRLAPSGYDVPALAILLAAASS